MIKKVKKTIDHYRMLDEGDTLVVALSGGADSCALLAVMVELEAAYNLKIIVAHFNHGLRGEESDREESFCRNLAQKYHLRFETSRMPSKNVPKGESPEDYYRRERYRFLNVVLVKYGAKKIALGHHLSDQAETVLLNIVRGSGMEGLRGILPVRDDRYIRPMIDVSKKEITSYLQEHGLEFCNDSSNQSNEFLRNRTRLELMPFLKEKFNPQIEQGLARMARMINRDNECLNGDVRRIMTSGNIENANNISSFCVDYFNQLPEALRFRLIKAMLEDMTREGKGIYYNHIQSVVELAENPSTGKQISLPFNLEAVKQYDRILIKKAKSTDIKNYEYSLSIPGTIDLKERGIILSIRHGRLEEVDFKNSSKVYFDPDKIRGSLTLRNRRPGDWFEPLGTKGRQKIKKLFIDHKVPRSDRNSMAILADELSVLWVENMHLCDRVRITPGTSRLLVLEIRKLI